jgi:signal transduction histidine kinase
MLEFVMVYSAWKITEYFFIRHFFTDLIILAIDVALMSSLAIGFMLRISRRIDANLASLEQLQAEHESVRIKALQLEAVQATVRSLAHNLNQPLTAALGYLQLFLLQPREEREDDDIIKAQRAMENLANLVRQFQAVTRYQTVPYPGGDSILDLSD